MARLHGRRGEISISASTTPEGSPSDVDFSVVGSLSGWSLAFTKDRVETTHLRSAGKTFRPGLSNVSGGFDGTFDTDYISTFISAHEDADAVWIRITPDTDYPELFFQGSAWIDVSVGGSVNDAVKVSGTFQGNGVWQKSFNA